MELTVLTDNYSKYPYLTSEYGLSLHISDIHGNILMDTGQGEAFLPNAKALEINLKEVDHLVLSHGHFDHVGGVSRFLTYRGTLPVWVHPNFEDLHMRLVEKKEHFIGCHLNTRAVDLHPIRGLTQITERIWAIEVPQEARDPLFWNRPEHLVVPDDIGGWKLDPFDDDISLIVKGDKGLSVLLGCAHAGVVNILEEISRHFDTRQFYVVAGGMHIGDRSSEFIERITKALVTRFSVQKWRPCHCSGFRAAAALAAKAPDVDWAGAGTQIFL